MPGQALTRVVFATAVLTFLGATAGVAFGLAKPADPGNRPVAQSSQQASTGVTTEPSVPQDSVSAPPSAPASGNGSTNGDNSGNGGTTETVKVPGVNGYSESDARTQLKNRGLGVTVKYSCDGNTDAGKVSYQQPYADSSVKKGSKVALTVEGVKVLDVVGQHRADARSQLEALNFKVSENDPQPGDSGGSVSKQSPSGGSCVKWGSTVTLWIAGQSSPQAQGSPDPAN